MTVMKVKYFSVLSAIKFEIQHRDQEIFLQHQTKLKDKKMTWISEFCIFPIKSRKKQL